MPGKGKNNSGFGDEVKNKKENCCSFCGRPESSEYTMIQGPGCNICSDCVNLCMNIIKEQELKQWFSEDEENPDQYEAESLPSPAQLKELLDQYVIGQDKAKKVLSVAVYNHYKRIFSDSEAESKKTAEPGRGKNRHNKGIKNSEKEDVELSKSNILLIGPTGSGKTLLAQTLARILHVPFAIADATALTEAGYVGEDVENILLKLIQAADGNIEMAERGIVYIDEIDKITRRQDNPSITRDVSGEGVQQALLKILESTVANVPPQGGRKHPHQEFLQIDTTNILFICGGAFSGLDSIIMNRVNKLSFGFGADREKSELKKSGEILSDVEQEDLLKFGLIPEFIGRVPVICTLNELGEEDLIRIMTEPRNALVKQYKKLLKYDGVKLEFTQDAIKAIAKKALERKSGARGLRSITEDIMLDVMYKIPSRNDVSRCIVTEDCIVGKAEPELVLNENKKKTDGSGESSNSASINPDEDMKPKSDRDDEDEIA